jgi:hypothetical protein
MRFLKAAAKAIKKAWDFSQPIIEPVMKAVVPVLIAALGKAVLDLNTSRSAATA